MSTNISVSRTSSNTASAAADDAGGASEEGSSGDKPPLNGVNGDRARSPSVPLPPANAFSHEKQPGYTRGALKALVDSSDGVNGKVDKFISRVDPPPGASTLNTPIPSAMPTPNVSAAPTPSVDVESQNKHKILGGKSPLLGSKSPKIGSSGGSNGGTDKKKEKKEQPFNPNNWASTVAGGTPSRAPSRASSIKSEKGDKSGDEGHKFTLKDLLANGPKLARRSSQRSTGSSKKSDSDIDHVEKAHFSGSKSQAGDSAASLSSKYGVCQKVAIGKGATSVVRLAHKWDRREEKLYAVKEFRKRRKNETEKEYVKKLTAEFCISSTLHHTNIVETVDLVQDENQKWCEVMEFCPGGDLYAAIKKGGMSPAEVECCFKQILCGLSYLHSQGVAHRDIKPENLFFDQKGHLKIGDFGASTVYRLPWEATVHMSTGLCGSEPYIAPEQFLGRPYDARMVDIWAVGVVYYCLHFQELPWRAAQQSDTLYAAYASACAANPLPADNSSVMTKDSSSSGASKDKDMDKSGADKAKDAAREAREKHGNHGAVAGLPATINNLSPRACRPLIRHMLEPDPKKRATIEEVMQYNWYRAIPVCFEQDEPGHVHVNAKSMANAVVKEVREG